MKRRSIKYGALKLIVMKIIFKAEDDNNKTMNSITIFSLVTENGFEKYILFALLMYRRQ